MPGLKQIFEEPPDGDHPTSPGMPVVPRPKSDVDPPSGLRLVVVSGSLLNTHTLPSKGEVVIGRAPEVSVYVPHSSVSRKHAVLRVGAKLELEDLGSRNGTAVNNTPLAPGKKVTVGPEDSIRVGQVLLVIQRDWQTPPVMDASGTSLDRPAAKLRDERSSYTVGGKPIVATSDAMRRILAVVGRVANTNVNVLILGETGTGKEVVARALHEASPRRAGAFLGLNCAALSEPLLESELFGHEKGAFTGAQETKVGLLEKATGGTVFLDEVGDMAPVIQAKLLRVFEERQVMRLGSLVPRPVDVRFVAATNKNLAADANAGRFRKDFYFRLSGVSILIPPLRERSNEIEPLARLFAERFSSEAGRPAPDFTPEAIQRLLRHTWPGNARELKNVVERACLMGDDAKIRPEHLDECLTELGAPEELPPAPPTTKLPAADLGRELKAVERQRIIEALDRCGGNQTRAAAELGMARRTLVRKISQFGISSKKAP